MGVKSGFGLSGRLEFYERSSMDSAARWRKVLEVSNLVLNTFYNDLFQAMIGTNINLQPNALAFGYATGTITPTRADTGLVAEWINPVTTLTTGLANNAVTTSLAVAAVPPALASGAQLQLGGAQTVITSGATAIGATSIPVSSFTTSQIYNVGTPVAVTSASWIPQRAPLSTWTTSTTDPPSVTLSFYLAAIANSIPITFTEVGLLYRTSSLVAGGSPSYLASHLALSYSKSANLDLRVDYVITRSLT